MCLGWDWRFPEQEHWLSLPEKGAFQQVWKPPMDDICSPAVFCTLVVMEQCSKSFQDVLARAPQLPNISLKLEYFVQLCEFVPKDQKPFSILKKIAKNPTAHYLMSSQRSRGQCCTQHRNFCLSPLSSCILHLNKVYVCRGVSQCLLQKFKMPTDW